MTKIDTFSSWQERYGVVYSVLVQAPRVNFCFPADEPSNLALNLKADEE